MRLRVINPNTTRSMTAAIGAGAQRAAGPDVAVETCQPVFGPESIESHADEVMAAAGVLSLVEPGDCGVDGYVIACFGDPGLAAAREVAAVPVVGIAEAAMHTASLLGRRFSVVTTLDRSVGGIEDLAVRYGLERRCGGIHASGIPVVELETDPAAYDTVRRLAAAALTSDRSDAIVLGCAGMTDLRDRLSADLGVPVVDGVAAAVHLVGGLVRQGLSTGKRGEFAVPEAKRIAGRWGDLDATATALGTVNTDETSVEPRRNLAHLA